MAKAHKTSNGTWRIQIMVNGTRSGGTFDTEEQALTWADKQTGKIKRKDALRAASVSDVLLANVPKKLVHALESAPYTKEEVMKAALPAHSMTGVYFLMLDQEIVYVGQSVDVLGRVSRHKREGKEFDSFAYILCKAEDLNDMEAKYITILMPWLNFTLGRVPRNINVLQD